MVQRFPACMQKCWATLLQDSSRRPAPITFRQPRSILLVAALQESFLLVMVKMHNGRIRIGRFMESPSENCRGEYSNLRLCMEVRLQCPGRYRKMFQQPDLELQLFFGFSKILCSFHDPLINFNQRVVRLIIHLSTALIGSPLQVICPSCGPVTEQ